MTLGTALPERTAGAPVPQGSIAQPVEPQIVEVHRLPCFKPVHDKNGQDFGDDDFVDGCALLVDASDFEAGAAEEGFEVGGGELAVDEVAEPVE